MQNAGSELMESIRILAENGVESPQLDSEILMAHVLGKDRMYVITHPEHVLSDEKAWEFRELVSRRAQREPLPYITGVREFWGMDFEVSRGVLIPRPETETLVQAALKHLEGVLEPVVVDVGAGSGCVAIAIAVELPEAAVYATEISPEAAAIARRNAGRNEVADRVTVLEGNLLDPLPEELRGQVDAAVSNPPYIPSDEIDGLQPEVARFEPRGALDGGPDGLKFVRMILDAALAVLRPGGWVHLEIAMGEAEAAAAYATSAGYAETAITNDLAGIGRVVSARK